MEKKAPAGGGAPGVGRPRKADPAVYSQMRRQALEMQLPDVARGAVQIVLMDWHVDKGTVTVLAAADGTASLYLSSGAGLVGVARSSSRYGRRRCMRWRWRRGCSITLSRRIVRRCRRWGT
jgi:hypothetical protein